MCCACGGGYEEVVEVEEGTGGEGTGDDGVLEEGTWDEGTGESSYESSTSGDGTSDEDTSEGGSSSWESSDEGSSSGSDDVPYIDPEQLDMYELYIEEAWDNLTDTEIVINDWVTIQQIKDFVEENSYEGGDDGTE